MKNSSFLITSFSSGRKATELKRSCFPIPYTNTNSAIIWYQILLHKQEAAKKLTFLLFLSQGESLQAPWRHMLHLELFKRAWAMWGLRVLERFRDKECNLGGLPDDVLGRNCRAMEVFCISQKLWGDCGLLWKVWGGLKFLGSGNTYVRLLWLGCAEWI